MPITYRAVKGSPLTADELDANFADLVDRIDDATDNPAEPVNIASVDGLNGSIVVTMTDASTRGPFDWPTKTFRWRGEWQASTEYDVLDMFFVDSNGLFFVLEAHTSGTEFDEVATGTELMLYQKIVGDGLLYDLGFYAPGAPETGSDSPLFQMVAARYFFFPESSTEFVRGYAYMRIAPTLDLALVLLIDGVQFGTVTFASGSNAGVVEVATTAIVQPGGVFQIMGFETSSEIGTGESTGQDLSITFKTYRAS